MKMKDQLPEVFPEPEIERITFKRIGASILAVLNLERGILYTLWALLISPGESMRTYLFVNRERFLEPVKLLILTVAVFLFFTLNYIPDSGFIAGFKMGYDGASSSSSASPEAEQAGEAMIGFIQKYMNVILLLSVPIAAMVSHWFFRSFRLKYTEHVVLNAFMYGFLSVVAIILVPVSIVSPSTSNSLLFLLGWLYSIYFFKDFFRITWGRSIWKSTLIYIVAQVLYTIILAVVVVGFVLIKLK